MKENPIIDAVWRPNTAQAENRTVELVWTTGADVERVDPYGDRYVERLRVDVPLAHRDHFGSAIARY